MTFGEKLRNLRGERSQDEMAKELNITKSSLAMYERNERIPRDEVKIRIAEYFGKTIEELFYTVITYCNSDMIKPEKVEGVCPYSDSEGKPIVLVKQGDDVLCFPMTRWYEIYKFNEFLRSLDLGVNVYFKSYLQYFDLIMKVDKLLASKRSPHCIW